MLAEKGFGQIWTRGHVSVPGTVLPAVALYDLIRKSRFVAFRTAAFFGWYLPCEVAGLLAAFFVWVGYRGERLLAILLFVRLAGGGQGAGTRVTCLSTYAALFNKSATDYE